MRGLTHIDRMQTYVRNGNRFAEYEGFTLCSSFQDRTRDAVADAYSCDSF